MIAQYIWFYIDLPSKSRWNYNGSSSGQAPREDREVISLNFKDPFLDGNNILTICDSNIPAGEPIPTKIRALKFSVWNEQENTLLQTNVQRPLGWPIGGYPSPQVRNYISNAHYKACLYAGVKISATNGEVMPSQYQVGRRVGIEATFSIVVKYLVVYVAYITEMSKLMLSSCLNPVLQKNIYFPSRVDWTGVGVTLTTEEGGFEVIKKATLNLLFRHEEHISTYREGNGRRLMGKHETANRDSVSWASCLKHEPYVVTSLLAETAILWEPTIEAEALVAQKLALKLLVKKGQMHSSNQGGPTS
ncbi:hypothetical protein ACJRO7_010365 [Eucalyptus globulus]|uniref:Glutamate--ammonia ligase n=1 Tax=Eucalyptus globulus TaxID=34317 RepID=A0ABD3LCM2_EUCGL